MIGRYSSRSTAKRVLSLRSFLTHAIHMFRKLFVVLGYYRKRSRADIWATTQTLHIILGYELPFARTHYPSLANGGLMSVSGNEMCSVRSIKTIGLHTMWYFNMPCGTKQLVLVNVVPGRMTIFRCRLPTLWKPLGAIAPPLELRLVSVHREKHRPTIHGQ